MGIFRHLKNQLLKARFLIKSDAPLWVIWKHFFLDYAKRFLSSKDAEIKNRESEFKIKSKTLTLDNDWFTNHISTWLVSFRACDYGKLSQSNFLKLHHEFYC